MTSSIPPVVDASSAEPAAANCAPAGVLRVLTVHFNTPELTSRLVRSFPERTRSGRPIAVHILDNASEPQHLTALRSGVEGLPAVSLDAGAKNLGFGEGMNVLADSYAGEDDILWLLNPDTSFDGDCLARLEEEIDAGEFDVISPLIFRGEKSRRRIWYCGGVLDTRLIRTPHLLFGRKLNKAPDHTFETEFITGAAPMMRAATFRAVGGFPADYFLYWEDAYFSWKASRLGFRLGVAPAARLWHAVGASSGHGHTQTYYYWAARNRFTFADDIGVPHDRLVTGLASLESIRFIVQPLFERHGRLAKARAAIKGTVEGHRLARG